MPEIYHVEHVAASFEPHIIPEFFLLMPFIIALIVYLLAFVRSKSQQIQWPLSRLILWILGIFSALFAITGPVADSAHNDFTKHMVGHLFLGMLAPLLMVLAAPMTLFLRTLNVFHARRLSFLLRSGLIRFICNPILASFINVGGLWILYTSSLYMKMHDHVLLNLLIHFHIFMAGYLFTASIIYIDPTPHRKTFVFRAIVLVAALAGHGILSKFIFAHPPMGVPIDQAETAAMLMYYGGDATDLVLIIVFCYQWSKAGRLFKVFNQSV